MDYRDAFIYYGYRLAGAITPLIPPRCGYRLAEQLGALFYGRAASRRAVSDNVSHILGEPADSPRVQTVVQQVFRNQAKNYFDLLRVASLSAEEIRKSVHQIIGLEHLDAALARGRGVVLVTGHFGNFDLAGQILAVNGYKVTAVAEHLRPERLFRYVRAMRESHGLSFIPIDRPLRDIFRALRTNEIVGLALDRNVTDEGRLTEFFGQAARLPDGYLRLAWRTEAALIVAFCRRLPDNTFVITVEPEVELDHSNDFERDAKANMRKVLSIFEAYLSRYPDQWVYFQPVWLPCQAEHRRGVGVQPADEETPR